MEVQSRQIAFLVQLKDILGKQYVEQEGWLPDYVVADWGEHISRVQVVGTVVDRADQHIVVDDGTATVQVRRFDEVPHFDAVAIGQTVTLIGKIRQYNKEQYVLAEIIHPVDSTFLQLHAKRLSLFDEYRATKRESHQEQVLDEIEEDIDASNDAPVHPLLAFIEANDGGEGVLMEDIISAHGDDTQRQLDTLLMNGDIFEIKPGVVKVLK